MKSKVQWALTAALALCAGSAYAQVGSQLNSCEGQVAQQGGAPEGVHSAGIVAASATPVDGVFWPANHKLRTVTISAENNQDHPCDVSITDVKQDEPVDGPGSGNTTPDAANCSNVGNASSVDLRGERAGGGTGRFYTISYTMHDPDTQTDKNGTATLLVPHDMGTAHFGTYVNEGPLYESNGSTMTAISCTQPDAAK